jgi:ribulose-phosphate 3-epimerase
MLSIASINSIPYSNNHTTKDLFIMNNPTQQPIISASILSADFAHLADDVNAALAAGADQIHFDVMDHHFVPNLSFGAVVCKALRKANITAPIDAHLMVTDPENYIEPFATAGANLITFHPETVNDVSAAIEKIHKAGMQAGLAFNPDKPVDINDELLKKLDMILLMSVFPGFGGQAFIPEVMDKIKKTRDRVNQLQLKTYVAVDGGVKVDNAADIIKAGADFLVIGSGLFSADNYQQCVQDLRNSFNK